jgi:hypothetical protein
MPDWHMYACDVHGNLIGELTTGITRQFTWVLTDACSASWTMDAMEADANYVNEITSDLKVYRNKQIMFRGRIMSSQDTIGEAASNTTATTVGGGGGGASSFAATSPDAHTVDFVATDYRGMLAHRLVPESVTYGTKKYPVDQCTIAWELIDYTQHLPGGDWSVKRGTFTSSTTRTYKTTGGTYIDQAIDDMANLNAGFDWEISPNMHFNTWPIPNNSKPPGGAVLRRGRGQDIGMKLTYGDNVSNVQRSLNASSGQPYSNVVRTSGSFTGGVKKAQYDVVSQAVYGSAFGNAGRWEYQVGNNNLTTVKAVQDAAIWELVRDANPEPSFVLTLTDGWWDPGQIWLGDLVTVTVNHGRLNDSWLTRVIQMDVFLSDVSGDEIVQVTTGPRYGNMMHRILRHEREITKITKSAN